jgi:hypothetical protein
MLSSTVYKADPYINITYLTVFLFGAFECLTKSSFIVNDKIKFTIDIYNKTGERQVDMSNYDPKAIELIKNNNISV